LTIEDLPGKNCDDPEHVIEVWKKTIDLQMHFNEMCLGIRRTAITVMGVLMGAGALAFRFGGQVQLFGISQSVAAVFIAIAFFVWGSFYLMDRYWYHELLRASVTYAETLDQPAKACGLNVKLNLSEKIREANRSSLNMSGGAKINLFYGIVAVGLAVAFFLLVCGYVSVPKL
jgi:hypothetical protein